MQDGSQRRTRNRINEFLRFDPERIHSITREKGAARLFFVTGNEHSPNGIVHVLRETRAQRRRKIGTDLGKPTFSDERDPCITDRWYDLVRYFVASRPAAPSEHSRGAGGTFARAQRHAKHLRQGMTIR